MAVRDETHRFATGLSRKLRSGDATFHLLQEVPGIGDTRARKILNTLGSLEAVAEAEPGYIKQYCASERGYRAKGYRVAQRTWALSSFTKI